MWMKTCICFLVTLLVFICSIVSLVVVLILQGYKECLPPTYLHKDAMVKCFIRKIMFEGERINPHPDGLVHNLSNISRYNLSTGHSEVVFIPSPHNSNSSGFVGAWYLTPPSPTDNKVILYLHGVSNTRAYDHRLHLYNVLLSQGFTVLAIDYRGFGDSSRLEMTETSVVEDSRAALRWLRERVGSAASILVWGHSLGAGIAVHTMAEEMNEGNTENVAGMVMESPFNNLKEEILQTAKDGNPLVDILLMVTEGLVGWGIHDLLYKVDMEFRNDHWLPQVTCPVMLLHAEDDSTISLRLAKKLYRSSTSTLGSALEFHTFNYSLGLGHNNIHLAENLPGLIEEFNVKARTWVPLTVWISWSLAITLLGYFILWMALRRTIRNLSYDQQIVDTF